MYIKLSILAALFLMLLPAASKGEVFLREGDKVWQDHPLEQYDAQLDAAWVTFPERYAVANNQGVNLGPVALRLERFSDGERPHIDYWVRIFPLPNIQIDHHFSVEVIISHVWSRAGKDIYKWNKKTSQIIQDNERDKPLTYISRIYLDPGTMESEVETIEGEIIFTLPVRLEVIEFDGNELKKEKKSSSGQANLGLIAAKYQKGATWLEMRYQGVESDYLTTLAYDKAGKLLDKNGFAKNDVADGWFYVYSFKGKVAKIKTVVSSYSAERSYPFTINP